MFSHTWSLDSGHFLMLKIDGAEITIGLEGPAEGPQTAYVKCTAPLPLAQLEAFLAKAKEHATAPAAALPGGDAPGFNEEGAANAQTSMDTG